MLRRISMVMVIVFCGVILLTSCAGESELGNNDKLIWYARINKQAANDAVFAKADEIVREKLGIGLDIIALEDYNTKIQVINASGEDFDIVYSSGTINNYFKNVADGNFLAIDELLPKYAPKLWNMFGDDIWDALSVDGRVYGVTNQQIMARAPTLYIPKQNIKLLGIDVERYKNFKLEDYEEYLKLVKEKTGSHVYAPDFWNGGGSQLLGIELVIGSNLPGAIRFDEENPVVFNQFESQEFKDYIAMRERWVKEGLTAPMHVTEEDFRKFSDYTEDQVIPWLGFGATYMPGVEAEMKAIYGKDVEFLTIAEPLLNSYGIIATMTAVNSGTKYPEKSVEFLELLHTDKEFYNLIAYGIEGVNFQKIDEEHIRPLNTEYAQPVWAIANMFNSYLVEGQPDDVWEQTKKINDEAKRSPLLGFTPNTDEIKLEIANCNAAMDEYLNVLCEGLMDSNNTYNAFMGKLKTAGCDTLIEKLNAQISQWRRGR